MTDYEVGRYALRTFTLHNDWGAYANDWGAYAFVPHTFIPDVEYPHYPHYPHTTLGSVGRSGTRMRDLWLGGTCTAECLRQDYGISSRWDAAKGRSFLPAPNYHTAPHKACTCGIYGALDYACLVKQFRHEMHYITAVIAAEGQTIIGTRGLRTQYARVVAWKGQDTHAEIAEQQFDGAKRYGCMNEMLNAYHIPRDANLSLGPGIGHRWWG